MNIQEIIKPENDLERKIITNEEWIAGATYPIPPRKGHPEGAVINHIAEVLVNVDKYCDKHNRTNLRLITLIHDTFKSKVDDSKQKSGENHHAMIARRFAESIGITNDIILEIIELHDEGYNSWQKGFRDGRWDKAKERAEKLIHRLDATDITALDLYLTFYRCDNLTGDKTQDNFEWFEHLIL